MTALPQSEPERAEAEIVQLPADQVHYLKWSMIERKLVAQETAIQLFKHNVTQVPESGDKANCSILYEAVAQAQILSLPRERQRLHISRNALGELFFSLLADAMKQIEKEKAASAPVPTASPSAQSMLKGTFESLIDELIQARLKPLEELYTEELDRLGKELNDLRSKIAQKTEPVAYVKPDAKWPTVGIFGCLNGQFENLRKKVEEMQLPCTLKFYAPESKEKPNVEWALFLRWSSHKHWNEAKSMGIPAEKMAFLHTGFTSAVRLLEAWFGKEKE